MFDLLDTQAIRFLSPRMQAFTCIQARYEQLGGASGPLGFSLDDTRICVDGLGFYRHYQNGSIYWSAASGAYEVRGEIRIRWAFLGGERGPLGYPISGETSTADGMGLFNHFQSGSIYWSPRTRAHDLRGPIREHWLALGGERSILGYPITGEYDQGSLYRVSQFERGMIRWSQTRGIDVIRFSG
ncbi:MAG TPA: hypothetical protein VF498_16500 [Anaerolineales bacterium]